MIKIKNILFPTDFSVHSNHAIEYATTFAGLHEAKLHLLHVIEPIMDLSEFNMINFNMKEIYEQMEKSARKQMEKISCNLKEKGIQHESIISDGIPFLEIIRTAREKEIDLIVISTHGRTGLAHVLFGSVAEKVVRKAPCSVFVVKKPGNKFIMP